MRPTRKLFLFAVVFLGLGLCLAPQAQAGWYGHHAYGYYGWGYGGCYGTCCAPICAPVCTTVYRPTCTTSCWGSCYGSCYNSWHLGVRPGPVRRFLFGPYRWYRTWGCCNVCGVDPCCCGAVVTTTFDSSPSVQSTQRPTLAPANVQAAEPAPAAAGPTLAPFEENQFPTPAPSAPLTPVPGAIDPTLPLLDLPNRGPDALGPPAAPAGAAVNSTEGTISILVPDNAQVTINGFVTKSTGRVRRYVAQNLKPGLVYPFSVQVDVVRDGRLLTETRHVRLVGGTLEAVAFDFNKDAVGRIAQIW